MMEKIVELVAKAQGYAKAIVAGVGSVLIALTSLSGDLGVELIPAEAQGWVVFGLAALTSFSTWAVPNGSGDSDGA
jgi:hypothetical protein